MTICLALALLVFSQTSSAITCPNSFVNANATGNASFAFDNKAAPGDGNFVWVYSVFGNSSNITSANLWLGSPLGVDLSSTANEFSACGIELSLPENTIERGQADEGICEQTLDPICVASLKLAAENAGDTLMAGLVSDPIMSLVCSQIASSIIAATKNSSCAPYFSVDGASAGSAGKSRLDIATISIELTLDHRSDSRNLRVTSIPQRDI